MEVRSILAFIHPPILSVYVCMYVCMCVCILQQPLLERTICLRATRDIAAEEEITISYGDVRTILSAHTLSHTYILYLIAANLSKYSNQYPISTH